MSERTKQGYARRSPSGLLVASGALGLIGGTPLVRLMRISEGATLWGKAEFVNAAGSVKDRPAFAMILAAAEAGELVEGASIIEATSGNTGISLAMIAAVRGYRCVLVMPEDMSLERRYILRAYGAEIVLTPAQEGMAGAVARATELLRTTPGAFMPSQFSNPANPGAHERGTALEILEQLEGDVRAFVAGVGTGGTITGVGRVLRERLGSEVRLVAVEPAASAVLSGKRPGMHGIQGLGAGFVPENLDRALLDEVLPVTDVAAEAMVRRLAREEGLLVGPSSGANVHAALEVGRRLGEGNVVTVLCDSGERYLF
ncbi:MAG: cysteine synthase A [Polyangiaceae bacterium]|nr:cysteine synthase A [Polyangiaceae bacterium]MCW5790837.1 cysteine synthase A [Polyangiaceae bacterium]